MSSSFENLLDRLRESAVAVDSAQDWPARQIEWLAETDVLKSVIPTAYGGVEIDAVALAHEYHDLAKACLTTCFILTQRNGACQRIAGSENDELKSELLPKLATGELFATVGISHLTTSRQHVAKPAIEATIDESEIVLSGDIPWVTGAAAADVIVTGGTCEDGQQVLIAMPTDLAGISSRPSASLMALTSSETTSVQLDNVRVPKSSLIAGPVEGVMSQGKGGGAGSLTTSTLALGLCSRMLEVMSAQVEKRPELASTRDTFQSDYDTLAGDLFGAMRGEDVDSPQRSASTIRTRSNSLALRITQAALTMTKGAGFVKGHPVELAVREAMFFLVWSCPVPVAQGVLEELSCRE